MYITVPMRNQKNKKYQKKHQQSIFKEIQYSSIFQRINQQDELKKSNGFTAVKLKLIKNEKQNQSLRNSFSSFRRASQTSEKFKRHRPSVSSILSSKQKSRHDFFKTTGDIFEKRKYLDDDQFIIEEKPEERESQEKHQEDHEKIQCTLPKQNSFQNVYETFMPEKPKKLFKQKRKNVTLLDLKVQNIEEIIKKSGNNHAEDFAVFAQKDTNKITTSCWKKFYSQMTKTLGKKQLNLQTKIQNLRRTATSHQKRKVLQPENPVEQILLQKKRFNNVSVSQCVSPHNLTPRKKSLEQDKLVQSDSSCPLESENMWEFFNFVKGTEKADEYSKKMSLNHYRKSVPKFYILRNSEEAIKQSLEYKKITMENFKSYKPGQMLSFMYLNENQYKLKQKKNAIYMNEVIP